MTKKTLLLDAGHGGLNSKGVYTTPAKDGKYWKHNRGTFHKGSIFYEGVSNREFANEVFKEARHRGINIVKIYHPTECPTLNQRVTLANNIHSYSPEGTILISLHSNAINSQDKASGFSVFTSPGKTTSDAIAESIYLEVEKCLSKKYEFNMRSDKSDGDHDYEARLTMLTGSSMPAVLIENLFFDNYKDALLLMNKEYQREFAVTLLDAVTPYLA